ncbi:hypothetical protein LTR66_014940 [Elasticomyces elasticus]|nr:hypothetical protein LTR66_014940 [Elasticomyces elasticus]
MADFAIEPNLYQEADDFLNFLDEPENAITGVSKAESTIFTSSAALQRYLGHGNTLSRLIRTLLPEEDRILEPSLILTEYVAVFSTLVTFGHAHLLKRFVDSNFSDEKLPILDKPRRFPKAQDGQDIFEAFFAAQWRFCPLEFRRDKVGVFVEPEQILPIISKELVTKTSTVTTYKVTVHEDYDPFCEGNGSSILKTSKTLSQPKHTYLFKEFSGSNAQIAYEKELAAFLHLQKTGDIGKTIVNFYGSFIHDETRTIILEYGDRGSLADFFTRTHPPSTSEEVSTLWQAFLQIQKGLHAIHNIPRSGLQQASEVLEYSVLRGWHQNIMPANIMVVGGKSTSPFDCQFRIANLATIEDQAAASATLTENDLLSYMPQVYAAPELYTEKSAGALDITSNQKTDVWSLGCLFSEFAVWMVLGSAKLDEYREDRRQETVIFDVKNSGCFHDGQAGLPCVRLWNSKAIENKRSSDHVTKGILRQMVSEMLYENGDARPTTTQLLTRATDII